jgi:phenylacetate-CoA ligase
MATIRKAYWNAFTLWHLRDEKRLPYRPPEELLAIQNRRVKAIVAHAYDTVPYYRQAMDDVGLRPRDFRTADDLAILPIHTGAQLARDPVRFKSSRYSKAQTITLQSSGTSGHPKRIEYDPAALFIALAHGHRQRLVLARFLGRTFGYREMDAVRSAGSSVILRNFYDAYSWTPRGMDLKRRILSAEESLESNIAHINAFKPDVIRGYATYIGAIFRRAHERNLALSSPKVVAYGSDRLSDFDRQLIESEFGVRVTSTYQAVEALRIAFQCELSQGFHISLDDVAVRVVDADGKSLGPGGTGEIVISNLTNRATVLLNYKLGDVVTLSTSTCACGRTLPTLQRIDGRSDDLVVFADGRVIHSLVVLQGLRTVHGVVQLQLVQEALRHFSLRAVCAEQIDWQQARRDFDGVLRGLFGDDIILDLQRVETIAPEPGGKVRAVISRCPPRQ